MRSTRRFLMTARASIPKRWPSAARPASPRRYASASRRAISSGLFENGCQRPIYIPWKLVSDARLHGAQRPSSAIIISYLLAGPLGEVPLRFLPRHPLFRLLQVRRHLRRDRGGDRGHGRADWLGPRETAQGGEHAMGEPRDHRGLRRRN